MYWLSVISELDPYNRILEFEQTLLEAGASTRDDELKITWLQNALASALRTATVGIKPEDGYDAYCEEIKQITYQMSKMNGRHNINSHLHQESNDRSRIPTNTGGSYGH